MGWLLFVSGVQIMYGMVGLLQCVNGIRAMRRVKATCLRHSEVLLSQKDIPEKETEPVMSHVFILPNYKEPDDVLEETIGKLAEHDLAYSYTIVLAMEVNEEGHEEKAGRLIAMFSDSFRRIFFTSHVLQEGLEERGKASNEGWAARYVSKEVELYPELYCNSEDRLSEFSSDNVVLHIIDADAEVHGAYTLEVEASCKRIMEERPRTDRGVAPPAGSITRTIFAPPSILGRNGLEVPGITRMQDQSMASTSLAGMTTFSGVGFPLSNYSLTLALAEDVDYWDTNADSIAEDFHMFLKCFFKTDGAVRLEPIYVPFNMLNLDTGKGAWATFKARFVQAERHYRGVADLAYVLLQISRKPKGVHKWIVLWQSIVALAFPAVIPFYMMVAGPFCQLLQWTLGLFTEPALAFLVQWTQAFGVVGLLIMICLFYCSDAATRCANTHLYQRRNLTMYETFYPTPTLVLTVWIFIVIPFTLTSFKQALRLNLGQYVVAEKKSRRT